VASGGKVRHRAVKLRQTMGIIGKMRADPIQNHADAGAVAGIHKLRKPVGAAMLCVGRRQTP